MSESRSLSSVVKASVDFDGREECYDDLKEEEVSIKHEQCTGVRKVQTVFSREKCPNISNARGCERSKMSSERRSAPNQHP